MINDLVIDTKGRVIFVLLSYGEKSVAVPFETLAYNSEAGYLLFNTAGDKLESAPPFEKQVLSDQKTVEDIYRHFGHQPYWSEDEIDAQKGTAEVPMPMRYLSP
jgi:hypothetical protein